MVREPSWVAGFCAGPHGGRAASSARCARAAAEKLEVVRRALSLAFLLLALSLSIHAFARDCEIACDPAEPVCGQEVTFRASWGQISSPKRFASGLAGTSDPRLGDG